MAKIYKCDRCGMIGEEEDFMRMNIYTGAWRGQSEVDLCKNCNKRLNIWMKG